MFFQHGAAMKRFTFKGVLDNFRQSVSQPTKSEQPELIETLKTEHCQLARTARHGFPHQPTALAYDPIQRLVAIGTKSGAIRILGRPGVSVQVRHDPVPDPSAAGSGTRGGDVTGAAAASVSVGASGVTEVPGGGPGRGSNAGLASGCAGINQHPGVCATGPTRDSNTSASVGGGGGGSSSVLGAAGATGGHIAAGSSIPAGQSGNIPSNHASGGGHHPPHGGFSTTGPAVIQLQFLINEGALVSATSDDSLHLWNIRQKRPDIVHTLKFQRERITCFHLPFQSKWLYVGTERGNVHIVNIESFSLSGYVINWNKAIELSCKTHPGPVIHLSDCPTDPSKLLMGFESGLVVLWDLRTKVADARFLANEPLRSVSWLSDGKQLISAHTDGSLHTWNVRAGPRPAPVSVTYPHAKGGREGKPECKAIQKVEWKSSSSGDPFVIFSGGLPIDRPGRSSSITVIHGRNTTVLEMEHNVVDFVALCDTPWTSAEEQDPHAIIVLLQNDLVIIDLLSPGFPCFENPYPMDIHESAVTCCLYIADCPGDLIPALYSVGAQGHSGFSKREWPINGGQWGSLAPSYAEMIVTGHVDGTVKFWDTSSLSLQVLYRLKTSKVFEKSRTKTLRPDGELATAVLVGSQPGKQHLAIKQLAMCPENRLLAIAGASGHVILFKFRRQEVSQETIVLGVPLFFENAEEPQGSPSFGPGAANLEFCLRKEQPNPLSVRGGVYRRPPGFQVDLVCLSSWMDGEAPGSITALSVNSAYGLMAYGNDGGLVLVDIIQKSVLLSMASVDLYSSADPYTRLPRSPKRPTDGVSSRAGELDDNSIRSPSCDQNQVVEHSVDEVDAVKSVECLETEVDRAVEASADDEHNQPEAALTTEEEGKTENGGGGGGGRVRKKKNFNLKKQLSKADTKLRDLFAPVSRRGSGASTGAGTASAAGGLTSPHLADSKPVSPQEEQQAAFHFPEPADGNAAVPAEPLDSTAAAKASQDIALFDPDGIPIRPPRRLKKSLSAAATHQKTGGHRDCGWKRTWYSSDSDSTALAPPAQIHVLDLRFDAADDSCHAGFLDNLVRKFNKSDMAFTRSRSSSTSSLENQTNEAVTTLTFADTLARKLDTAVSASLWVGTSQGSVLVIVINLAAPGEPRLTQPVMISPSGSIFRIKGSMLCVAFIEPSGSLISNPSEPWRDETKEARDQPSRTGAAGGVANDAISSDDQYTVMVSEKQARVVSLPSQTCLYRVNLAPAEGAFAVTANVVNLKDGPCLATFLSNGHIQVFSLPSLRPLMDVEFTPLVELSFQTSRQNLVDPMLSIWAHQQLSVNEDSDKIARNFRFSSHGHGMYLCSPSEIEKFTISSAFASTLGDLMGELFMPCEMPEPPKEGFFKGLFGGGVRPLDREELFGESTGKAGRGVARHIPGPAANLENLTYKAGSVAAEVQKTRQALNERGDKLGMLEDRTQRMANEAENFSNAAHQLMVRCRERKWYQL
ncbi:LOW QUALITY PROTEIN: syntaxin-binding protein 5 [Daphnia magna]|uniref:LOW QUALITY PROTEIN: syntaxin-binding protein 5 n=1 Tax=Daphnia magna TaxID=35525 RepID=UPI001E1BCD4A|nr:LOW QUALITY PROTEIN: syntaxin-binding protein 5 [Daphnia magna]